MRVDLALVERGLARSRGVASSLLAGGQVSVNGVVVTRAAHQVVVSDQIRVAGADHYVSRAAHKLRGALADSGSQIRGDVLDAGASTGGFTQVCLEAGANRVYAVDVGHGQLVETIRADPRVIVWERTNLRDLTLGHTGGVPVDRVVADVSFISLTLLLAPLLGVLAPDGEALLLVKPQFEVGRGGLDSRGVVKDPHQGAAALEKVVELAGSLGWGCVWQGPSRVVGEHGNQEHFIRLRAQPAPATRV